MLPNVIQNGFNNKKPLPRKSMVTAERENFRPEGQKSSQAKLNKNL